jgi:signal transduction histidine kinase
MNAVASLPAGGREPDLHAGIASLTSLLALPALWSGRDAPAIVRTLFEALDSMLPVEAGVLVQERGGDATVQAWTGGRLLAGAELDGWDAFARFCRGQTEVTFEAGSPRGALRVARAQMSYGAVETTLWVASREADFPSAMQRTYLAAATSLAATGLNTARLNAERLAADCAKDEFLAMLAHELRNPLAPISNALNLLHAKNQPEIAYERDVIGRQVKHLSRLVDDLLDIARVARGKIELRQGPVDLAHIIAEAAETAHPLMELRRHSLSIDLPQAPQLVYGDGERLKQVVANLLTNAAKYTEPGGRIGLFVSRAGERVRIVVRDNGIGIGPELLPHVFDLFRQGKTSPDRAQGGLGIGLSLVKSLVELHGGTVRAHSAGAQRGAEFTVELPAHAQAGERKQAAEMQPAAAAAASERVLVVDDNDDAASSMARLLAMLGHEVHVAGDGTQALDLARRHAPSIALLDIGLPGMDGYELAARLRELPGAPRLVAVTGYGQPHDRARSLAAGFERHYTKPLLLDALQSLFGK